MANCVPTGVYTTSGVDSCHYIADHSEAELIIVQNEIHLQKYLSVIDRLPRIKALVVYWPTTDLRAIKAVHNNVYSWTEFLELGTNVDPAEIDKRISNIRPSQTMTIVYTSGTTGPPKGVLLSHDNYIWCARASNERANITSELDEHFISYLPLSHCASQCLDCFSVTLCHGCLHFADENALVGSLGQTIKEVRPTFFFAVPRIWEKIEEKVKASFATAGPAQKKLISWAREIGYRSTLLQLEKKPVSNSFHIAVSVFFSKLKESLGFDRVRTYLFGAAPISKSTIQFYLSLNISLRNAYGMSECAAPVTSNAGDDVAIWSAGKPLNGADLRIFSAKGEELPRGEIGEICFKGRNKFLGYLKNEKDTRETIDENGFVHSGDEGYLDSKGFLYITGRIKELIITAGGENVPPVLIEEAIRQNCKILNSVLVVGEGKKYVAALVSFKRVLNPDGTLNEKLTPEVLEILASISSSATENTQAMQCDAVKSYIQASIDDYNRTAASRVHQIKKWGYLPNEFSILGGELTATMKLKRKFVHLKYESAIEQLFTDPNF